MNIRSMTPTVSDKKLACFHCGLPCPDKAVNVDNRHFCCEGCLQVYQLLTFNGLNSYYRFSDRPGARPNADREKRAFAYLDNTDIKRRLVNFSDGCIARVTFFIPSIHCTSCIWLLENLSRLHEGVISSRVNFLKKEFSASIDESKISVRLLAELITSLGYEPQITLEALSSKTKKVSDDIYKKLAVAGFCFANVMLFSFPEYLAIDSVVPTGFRRFFGYVSILLSLPVLLYSASLYFKSAYYGIKQRLINIDFPISLGIVILFTRSVADIVLQRGPGYLDSFTGLVFLLLIGKVFQKKTYDALNFERDYKAYFPISVTITNEGRERAIPITDLKAGDCILVRNQELVPADSKLISAGAKIDYSFVTGEALPVDRVSGELIFAGGKIAGPAVELEVTQTVSRSYITQLWNEAGPDKESRRLFSNLSNVAAKYFTYAILLITALAAGYWLWKDWSAALDVATAVLIIACPCALALSAPFALGTAQRLLGRNGLYLKNSSVIETLSRITAVVFDKTGTLTVSSGKVLFVGEPLSPQEIGLIKSLSGQSTHPLSHKLHFSLDSAIRHTIENFNEQIGQGLEAKIDGHQVRLGSEEWIFGVSKTTLFDDNKKGSRVYVSIDGRERGYFLISGAYRDNVKDVAEELKKSAPIYLLSGDNEAERARVREILGQEENLHFNQTPAQKRDFIADIKSRGHKVLMIGDGLNDAGALRQSDVGIAVGEKVTSFTPASDGIIDAGSFELLGKLPAFSRKTVQVIIWSFVISFLYNLIGISLAVQNLLSPIIAAVLMPLSSISVIVFSTLATRFAAHRMGIQ